MNGCYLILLPDFARQLVNQWNLEKGLRLAHFISDTSFLLSTGTFYFCCNRLARTSKVMLMLNSSGDSIFAFLLILSGRTVLFQYYFTFHVTFLSELTPLIFITFMKCEIYCIRFLPSFNVFANTTWGCGIHL